MSTTKEQIMESYFNKYGIASSVAELSGLLHKRFPTKKGCFKDEARDFIVYRINEHRSKQVYHYQEDVRYAWNPRYMQHAILHELKLMLKEWFTPAFQGLAYQQISK